MKLLFICTGNMCRSPAAELMLEHIGGEEFQARSRGTQAQAYSRMPRPARAQLYRMGITEINHTPELVTEPDIEWADLILVMENRHFEELAEKFPQSQRKMHLLLDYCGGTSGKEVRDPMGGSEKLFEEVLAEIREAVTALVRKGTGPAKPA